MRLEERRFVLGVQGFRSRAPAQREPDEGAQEGSLGKVGGPCAKLGRLEGSGQDGPGAVQRLLGTKCAVGKVLQQIGTAGHTTRRGRGEVF